MNFNFGPVIEISNDKLCEFSVHFSRSNFHFFLRVKFKMFLKSKMVLATLFDHCCFAVSPNSRLCWVNATNELLEKGEFSLKFSCHFSFHTSVTYGVFRLLKSLVTISIRLSRLTATTHESLPKSIPSTTITYHSLTNNDLLLKLAACIKRYNVEVHVVVCR